jgi:hypothetical protein
MTRINNAKELNEKLGQLKALNLQQEAELATRLKNIETSLQPSNLIRQGITGILKGNKSNHGFIPVLIGAGVEAGLDRLLNSKTIPGGIMNLSGGGVIQKLVGNILGSGELSGWLKKLFVREKSEEQQEEENKS